MTRYYKLACFGRGASLPARFFAAVLVAAGCAQAAGAADNAGASNRRTPVVEAVQKAMPSVVNISTEQIVQVVDDPFNAYFNEYFSKRPRLVKEMIPLGSGVIVDSSGLLITNFHVVRRASKIMVRLADGSMHAARMRAGDAANDMALLQITDMAAGDRPRAIEFGAPDDLLLGESVVAVGNPFGLENTVSVGVLSARNRSIQEGNRQFDDIMQTDAAINPGNSGGPLINADGQFIGMNLAIRRDAEGIGFAIPARRIENVLGRWLVPSRFSQATCGFVPGTRVVGTELHAVAADVDPAGPAAQAGLKTGDRILRANGMPVSRALELGRVLWRLTPGQTLRLSLADGRSLAFNLPEMQPADLLRERLGLQLQELTPPLRKAMGLPAEVTGLAISSVEDGSPLAELGVRRGDIITQIGDMNVTDVEAAGKLLRGLETGTTIPVGLVTIQKKEGESLVKQFRITLSLR